jgi:outer membrane lipoprotein-sorting protein
LRISRRCAVGLMTFPSVLLAGCSLFPTTRKLPLPKAPGVTQAATADELVAQLNQRWAAVDSLTATVEIRATELKNKEGVEEDFPSCRGFILMRKPGMLRVVGQYFSVRIFDMASDGKTFTLVVPKRNIAFTGSDGVKGKSPNPMYNLRPDFFFDAMMVRGLAPDDFYSRMGDTETIEDAARKHLSLMPEYVLSITRHNAGSRNDTPVRVITFHRDDLLPYQQDLYDGSGNLETEVLYTKYADFGKSRYPSVVTIKRPQEGIQIVMTVERVIENPKLTDEQFQIKMPDGVKVQTLE